LAHARARERAKRPKPARLDVDPELRAVVSEELGLEWSPEQIATYLREAHPDGVQWHICSETIYQALYLPARGGLSRELSRKLRTGRPMRRRATQSLHPSHSPARRP
jgi:IS30 family transposase